MLQSVRTALDIFEQIATHQPIGVSEIARRLKLTKSTVQRCLMTLEAAGWIHADHTVAAKWSITARVLTLGGRVSSGAQIASAALPWLHLLREETRETVHLAVQDGRETVLIERLESPQPVRTYYPVGQRAPMNASATGKAILAFSSPSVINAFLSDDLRAVTPWTIIDPEAFRRELAQIRSRGWSESIGELTDDTTAIAAPISNSNGVCIAGISISAPTSRCDETTRARYGLAIVQTAEKITEQLTGAWRTFR